MTCSRFFLFHRSPPTTAIAQAIPSLFSVRQRRFISGEAQRGCNLASSTLFTFITLCSLSAGASRPSLELDGQMPGGPPLFVQADAPVLADGAGPQVLPVRHRALAEPSHACAPRRPTMCNRALWQVAIDHQGPELLPISDRELLATPSPLRVRPPPDAPLLPLHADAARLPVQRRPCALGRDGRRFADLANSV